MQIIQLFILMFGVGALTFGGGYAIVGVLQTYLVDKLHWITAAEFTSSLVVGQVTPGPLSTMVAYVGYKMSGLPGAVVATVGLLLPSFLCSWLIVKVYARIKDARWVKPTIKGISIAVIALLAGALVTLTRGALVDVWTVLIAVATFYFTGPKGKHPAWAFGAAAIAGALLYR